jgi:dTDP-4-dehydrorhamnose reductase
MKILLFGKNGQIGTELQRALVPGAKLIALGRSDADLQKPQSVVGAIRATKPDLVVNAAAYTAVDRAEDDAPAAHLANAGSVEAIAGEAARRGIWMIHYSTDYVFDGTKVSSYVETDPTGPLNVYGASKLVGENAIASSGARHVVLRTSWVYSAHGTNFARTMLRLARERDALRIVSDQIGAPTSASLIARVTAAIVRQITASSVDDGSLSGIYHLAAGGETSWHGFAQALIAQARSEGFPIRVADDRIAAIPTADYPTKARRPMNSRLDTSKLRNTFAISLPDWREDIPSIVHDLVAGEQR